MSTCSYHSDLPAKCSALQSVPQRDACHREGDRSCFFCTSISLCQYMMLVKHSHGCLAIIAAFARRGNAIPTRINSIASEICYDKSTKTQTYVLPNLLVPAMDTLASVRQFVLYKKGQDIQRAHSCAAFLVALNPRPAHLWTHSAFDHPLLLAIPDNIKEDMIAQA